LQDELHEITYSYANGGFSEKGFIFYPLVKDLSHKNREKINDLKVIAGFLEERGYDFSSTLGIFKKNRINGKTASLFISSLYMDFSGAKKSGTGARKIKCPELDLDDYPKKDLGYLKPVRELKKFANEKLAEHLADLHIHGSIATGDYVKGWSDLDTLIIIRKSSLENPKMLAELRDLLYASKKYFYKIDPLQHHGHMAVSEHDLDYYCQAFFPLILFKYSKSAFGVKSLNAKVRDSRTENMERFSSFAHYFRNLHLSKAYSMGSYDLKFLFHAVSLFPTLYLQARGIHVYKKFSFGIARKDFDDGLWDPIDAVTHIRKKWKSPANMPMIGAFSKINPLLAYQINSRYLDAFNKIKELNNFDIKKIVEGMHALSESALGRIKFSDA
jgi:predicted nucleotidyltransferase